MVDLVKLSQEVLLASKLGKEIDFFNKRIEEIGTDSLFQFLPDDNSKKAFWLNIYNTFIIQRMSSNRKDKDFYSARFIEFKDLKLSFDDIEHGILRKSKIKLGLGFLNKWKVTDWENTLRVNQLDYRVHFALNCGANSCPPITNYSVENVNKQLCSNTKNYLCDTSIFSTIRSNRVKVPRLFLWYFADFGGFKGIKNIYRKYNLVPIDTEPKFSFLSYDWTMNIENFSVDFK